MKKYLLLLLPAALALLAIPLVTLSYAAVADYDFSPKDGDVDGSDLAAWIASPGPDVAGFAGAFGQTYTVTTRPPNILLIVADDVGLDVTTDMYPNLITDLTALYGPSGHNNINYSRIDGRPASLPVLTDRLAAQGMVFANAWAQPYCSPTRAAIMTGLFADKTKVTTYDSPMKIYHTTFVQLLKTAGYSTAIFGKWHLAGAGATCPGTGGYSGLAGSATGVTPKQAGFDLFEGHLPSAIGSFWNYPYHVQDGATSVDNCRTDTTPTKSLDGIAATKFEPVVRVADAIEWIQTQAPDTPWFAYLPFNEVHTTTPPQMMHTPNADTLDAVSLAEVTACGATPGGTSNGTCTARQLNRAMTNSMDTVIGKLLDVVDFSNTYVIFVGDNGTPMYGFGNPVLNMIDNMYITTTGRGKGTVYESGARVAMAVRGPGIAAGGRSNEFVHVADLFATILLMAGLTPPAKNWDSTGTVEVDSDSKSLTPILFGSATTVRDPNEGYILTETSQGGNKVGARNGTYKVVCSGNTSNCTFFNLVADPLEEYPLSKPGSCTNYGTTYTTGNPEWHYCRLIEVINANSIF